MIGTALRARERKYKEVLIAISYCNIMLVRTTPLSHCEHSLCALLARSLVLLARSCFLVCALLVRPGTPCVHLAFLARGLLET